MDELYAIFSEASARTYTPAKVAPTRDAIANWAKPDLQERTGRSGLVVTTKGSPGEPLGIVEIAFNGLSSDVHFLIRESARGKGYMTEALSEIMRHNPEMGPFLAIVDAQNDPASKMLIKSGMKVREVFKSYRTHPALSPYPRDCILYSTN